MLEAILAYGCRIRGTLGVDNSAALEAILVSRNSISGTLSRDLFKESPNLFGIELSSNRISGVLPESMVSLRNVLAFLFNDMQLSGTVPSKLLQLSGTAVPSGTTRRTEHAVFSTLEGSCEVNGTCVTTSDFPLGYNPYDTCSMTVNMSGYLNASVFETEYSYDYLWIGQSAYSGQLGPQWVYTTAGTVIRFRADHNVEKAGWRLCWSGALPRPAKPQLHTLGLSRNFLTGSVQTHGSERPLRTMILSSNYLSCEAKFNGSELGKEKFSDPTEYALYTAGLRIKRSYPNIQPFGQIPKKYPNLVLVWPGNSQLLTGASYLPPQEPDPLRQADAIAHGRRNLFAGPYTPSNARCLDMMWVPFRSIQVADASVDCPASLCAALRWNCNQVYPWRHRRDQLSAWWFS